MKEVQLLRYRSAKQLYAPRLIANRQAHAAARWSRCASPMIQVGRIKRLIMSIHRPVDPVERAAIWRAEGWTGFNPDAPAHRPNGTEIERMRREWRDAGMGKQV